MESSHGREEATTLQCKPNCCHCVIPMAPFLISELFDGAANSSSVSFASHCALLRLRAGKVSGFHPERSFFQGRFGDHLFFRSQENFFFTPLVRPVGQKVAVGFVPNKG